MQVGGGETEREFIPSPFHACVTAVFHPHHLRELLAASHQYVVALSAQYSLLEQQLVEGGASAASSSLLRAQLARSKAELAAEEEVEVGLVEEERRLTQELAQAQLALSRFEEAQQLLEREEGKGGRK